MNFLIKISFQFVSFKYCLVLVFSYEILIRIWVELHLRLYTKQYETTNNTKILNFISLNLLKYFIVTVFLMCKKVLKFSPQLCFIILRFVAVWYYKCSFLKLYCSCSWYTKIHHFFIFKDVSYFQQTCKTPFFIAIIP